MTLDQLRYFCAVCQYHGVTRAASALNISQPSVSAAIKNLESEFNISLFHRNQKHLNLTTAGQELFALALPLLHQADALSTSMHSLGKANKIVRLGVPPMIGSLFLPPLYNALPSLSPALQLQVVEDDGNGLRKLLNDGSIDLALLPHTHTFDDSLCAWKVTELENVCCMHTEHPLSNRTKISLSDLQDQPLVLFKNSFFQTERILTAFRNLNCRPNVVLYTAQLSTLQQMIAAGSAIGFLFSSLASQGSGIVGIPLEPPMTTQVSLVWNKSLMLSDSVKTIIAYFKNLTK